MLDLFHKMFDIMHDHGKPTLNGTWKTCVKRQGWVRTTQALTARSVSSHRTAAGQMSASCADILQRCTSGQKVHCVLYEDAASTAPFEAVVCSIDQHQLAFGDALVERDAVLMWNLQRQADV